MDNIFFLLSTLYNYIRKGFRLTPRPGMPRSIDFRYYRNTSLPCILENMSEILICEDLAARVGAVFRYLGQVLQLDGETLIIHDMPVKDIQLVQHQCIDSLLN